MSRGLGRVQRGLLAAMRGGQYFDAATLAASVFGRNPKLTITDVPSRSEMVSVRHALPGLEERGLVFRVGRKWTRDKR
jgi:hypothetical protein